MLPQETIRRKRDGEELSAADIHAFIAAMARDDLSEGQIGAFAMAVRLKGMTRVETVALTLAMAHSGETLAWSDLGRPVADKHSTGGVGDNVSLMLAPIAAACGLAVPMISGRGLGHTGGTLDKLEAVAGYDIAPDPVLLREIVAEVGCAIVGQTAALAPADRRLYAVRDVTATVDSQPLITASILSKKLAAGLGSLVLDVKTGSGAFMSGYAEAETLAQNLVEVARAAGLKASALITDMNEPLADAAGNGLEMRHCIDLLAGRKPGTRSEAVVIALAAEMLVQAGLADSLEDGEAAARNALSSGAAADRFARMIHRLGGPADLVEHPSRHLAQAPETRAVDAPRSGFVSGCDAKAIGMAVIELGGGRRHPSDRIDHRVGFSALPLIGTRVEKGDPIGFVQAADASQAEKAIVALSSAYRFSDEPPKVRPLILKRL